MRSTFTRSLLMIHHTALHNVRGSVALIKITFLVAALTLLDFSAVAVFGQVCGGPQELGTIAGFENRAVPTHVSANGRVVMGYAYNDNNEPKIFRWTEASGMQDWSVLPARETSITAISADGGVIVGATLFPGTTTQHAFRWTIADGVQDLGTRWPLQSSNATDASADGSVVVGHATTPTGFVLGFRWTAVGGFQDLSLMESGYTFAKAVSADGTTVVGGASTASNESHFFRWTETGGMQDLGIRFVSEYPCVVSADGSVVVGTTDVNPPFNSAFRWAQAGGLSYIGTIPDDLGSYAIAVSDDGSTVVGQRDLNNPPRRAFRWTTGGGTQDLSTPDGNSEPYVTAVSSDGSVVVGLLSLASGDAHAFRWTVDSGMVDLGTLPSDQAFSYSNACCLSSDGGIVVGASDTIGGQRRAVRWGDADGDGLYDDWECNGIPYTDASGTPLRYILDSDGDGVSDANWQHKDLFVEVDAMTGFSLSDAAIGHVQSAFEAAPMTNPDGISGITLHVFKDEQNLTHVPTWLTNGCWPLDFDTFREDWYGTPAEHDNIPRLAAKAKAFRYCIVADRAGPKNIGGCGQQPGDNFVVYLGSGVYDDLAEASVFMHELGHNLGLGHGGGDDINGKPNYPSIMNYVLSYESPWNEEFWRLDFSRANSSPASAMRELNESALNELVGIGVAEGYYSNFRMPYGVTIDPDDGPAYRSFYYVRLDGSQEDFGSPSNDNMPDQIFSPSATQDLNYVTAGSAADLPTVVSPGQSLPSFNDWERVRVGLPLAATLGANAPAPAFPTDELTGEGRAWIDANFPIPPRLCDSIDFNRDDLFPDDADLVDFLSVLAGADCSTNNCNDIDFNNDGLFPDDNDLISFLRVLAGGQC